MNLKFSNNILTESSKLECWFADQDKSGRNISVVAEPKSHNLIVLSALMSKFSIFKSRCIMGGF